MTQAATDRQAMAEALQVLETELIEASDDGRQFQQLLSRRDAMRRELDRLDYLSRKEDRESEVAHKRALHERFAEACGRASQVRQEGALVNASILELTLALAGCLAEGASLTREHNSLAAQADNAKSALRRAGELPPAGGVGDARFPSAEIALAVWRAAHQVLEAAGLSPASAAAQQPHRRSA